MLDRPLRKVIDPWLDLPAKLLARWNVSANAVTVTGFLIGVVACVAIAMGHPLVGLVFIAANRIADGLDGCVARQTGTSDLGGFLDFIFDILFYGGVPFAFAIANPELLLPACFLVYSFMGTIGSFLTFAVISAKRGVVSDVEKKKSFYYSVGLMEGSETIIFFVLFCLFPAHFAMLAWIFGTLCWVTISLRVMEGVAEFRSVK